MLNNQTKPNIVFSLGMLAIFAFSIVSLPSTASALGGRNVYYGSDTYYPGPTQYDYNYNTQPSYYPVYVNNTTPTPVYIDNTTPVTPIYVNNTTTPTPVYINNTTPKPVVYVNTPKTVAKVTTTKSTSNNSNLAANAIFGSNGFMPNSLTQWIMVAILILIIVILARRIYGGAEKFHATPLKHS